MSKCEEGVILKVTPFQDFHQIIELFSEEGGRLRLLHKGTKSRRILVSPLSIVECIYSHSKRSAGLAQCEELSVIDWQRSLRHELSKIATAASLCQAIRHVFPLEAAAPKIYQLLKKYFQFILEMPESHYDLLVASFRLKLLLHEGLWPFENMAAFSFSSEEVSLLDTLAKTRSSSSLKAIELPPDLCAKIDDLFYSDFFK
jgi:DNA repair protein RecO (recombination protein O)